MPKSTTSWWPCRSGTASSTRFRHRPADKAGADLGQRDQERGSRMAQWRRGQERIDVCEPTAHDEAMGWTGWLGWQRIMALILDSGSRPGRGKTRPTAVVATKDEADHGSWPP
jgi:hypothetical protein